MYFVCSTYNYICICTQTFYNSRLFLIIMKVDRFLGVNHLGFGVVLLSNYAFDNDNRNHRIYTSLMLLLYIFFINFRRLGCVIYWHRLYIQYYIGTYIIYLPNRRKKKYFYENNFVFSDFLKFNLSTLFMIVNSNKIYTA